MNLQFCSPNLYPIEMTQFPKFLKFLFKLKNIYTISDMSCLGSIPGVFFFTWDGSSRCSLQVCIHVRSYWSWKFTIIPKMRNVCNVCLVRLLWHFLSRRSLSRQSMYGILIYMIHIHLHVSYIPLKCKRISNTWGTKSCNISSLATCIYIWFTGCFISFMFNGSFTYPLGFHPVILEAAWCQRVVPPRDRPQAALPLREEHGVIWWWVRDPCRWVSLHLQSAPQSAKIIHGNL